MQDLTLGRINVAFARRVDGLIIKGEPRACPERGKSRIARQLMTRCEACSP
ncbi:hypothetical protein LZ017_05470 [Pelomonas sp. CA6]|uniref:hypothetical protein n=1 Tax=Pelomonas sp. CA6 TaxID=2907999 RepID=UPI001F4AB2AA|nr:hypothetical protein [Pelomonas sp. CA6]MCH7342827.1 hypothetical protein [Pelomonas sp. CA6]